MLKRIMLVLLVLIFTAGIVGIAVAGQTHGPPGFYKKINGSSSQWTEGQVKYFKDGHPGDRSEWVLVQRYNPPCERGSCEDAIALAESGIMIVSPDAVYDIKDMGWGSAGGRNLTFEGKALATGKDTRFWFFKIPGFAWANVDFEAAARVCVLVLSNGEQLNGGLSITYSLAIGTLNFKGNAIAIGNDGCPQFAEVKLHGGFVTTASGHAYSETPNAYSYTTGEGTTGVMITAYNRDFEKYGWFIFPPTAKAGIEGTVIVKQDVFVTAYVSPDGLTSYNFGIVRGGEAMAFGDANIQAIRAKGIVQQASFVSGYGAAAFGNSTASFNGARGYVSRGGNYANVGGVAVVHGYNNITHTGNSMTITSSHSAFATTGNFGIIKGDNPQ